MKHNVSVAQMIEEKPSEHGFRVRGPSGIWGANCTCGWNLPKQYSQCEVTQLAEEHIATMSKRHAEMQRSITMFIELPDGTERAMTVAVDIERWFEGTDSAEYRLLVHDMISHATHRLIRLAAGKLSR